MLEVTYNGNIAKIDVRKRILRGEHPKAEIFEFVKNANRGTIVEIHLPHSAPPLIATYCSQPFGACPSRSLTSEQKPVGHLLFPRLQ